MDVFYFERIQSGEGGYWSDPYWPGSNSGLTIGIGSDLGQMTPADFRTVFGPPDGRDATGADYYTDPQLEFLYESCGLKGRDAKNYLLAHGADPATSPLQASFSINKAYIDRLDQWNEIQHWNGSSGCETLWNKYRQTTFSDLPPTVQESLFDLRYCGGVNFYSSEYLDFVDAGDYKRAAEEMDREKYDVTTQIGKAYSKNPGRIDTDINLIRMTPQNT